MVAYKYIKLNMFSILRRQNLSQMSRNILLPCVLTMGLMLFFMCKPDQNKISMKKIPTGKFGVQEVPFGTLPDGGVVTQYVVENPQGMEVRIINYGGIITHLIVPDKDSLFRDVVSGYDSLAGYLESTPYFGALVGRYANRIKGGKFSLDGQVYSLATNNGPNHLHGGIRGFDKVLWNASPIQMEHQAGVNLEYTSPSGEEGYPGTLTVKVKYLLSADNELTLDYIAVCDTTTIINLSNHSYFNLNGDQDEHILDHQLTIFADNYTPVDSTLIPTGALESVAQSPFDFRQAKAIGRDIGADHEQIRYGGGFDHNFVLNGVNKQGSFNFVAELVGPKSGIKMTVLTTEPGVQFYSGNFLNGKITGKKGTVYHQRHALCLETQHFPDSPNQPDFPSVVLRRGDVYRAVTLHKFEVVRPSTAD